MKTIAQSLVGKTAEWERVNPVLLKGMFGVEVRPDKSRRIKIGDGKRNWKDPDLKPLNPDDIEGLRNELDQAAEMVKKVKDVFSVNKTLEEIMGSMSTKDFENISALLYDMQGKITTETETRQEIIEILEERIGTLTAQLNKSRPRIVGEYADLSYELSDSELAANRLLKLEGQKIRVADYQELVDKKWVGRERNATALFWYKCNENGVRNPDGLYIVVEDWRGIFPRVAGVNSVLRTDMNNPLSTPYDGGVIGAFKGDAIRNIHAEFEAIGLYFSYPYTSGAFTLQAGTNIRGSAVNDPQIPKDAGTFIFNTSNVVPTDVDNHPAQMPVVKYIFY